MKVNVLNSVRVGFKNADKAVKKADNAAKGSFFSEENKTKRVLIGFAFAGLVTLAYVTKPKQLMLESRVVKNTMGKLKNSTKKIVQEFQEKADEVSDYIAKGAKNSFQDVYEDSKLIRKFITKEGSEIPSIMEEYGAKGGLLRRTNFADFKNFKIKEYGKKSSVLNVIKVKDGVVSSGANGIKKLPFGYKLISHSFLSYDDAKIVLKGSLYRNKGEDSSAFIRKMLVAKGEKECFFKTNKASYRRGCNIEKCFTFKNGFLHSVGVGYSAPDLKKGLKLLPRDFYRVNENGVLDSIRREELDREFLNDLVLDFIY